MLDGGLRRRAIMTEIAASVIVVRVAQGARTLRALELGAIISYQTSSGSID